MTMWTEALVREHLPNVKVKLYDGTIVDAQIRGQRCGFAEVSWRRLGSVDWRFTDVAWQTVASCLNRGHPIIVE